MARRPRLLAACAVFLGGCAWTGDRSPPSVPGLDSIPQVFRIEESGIDRNARWVVTSPPAWDSLWARIFVASTGHPPAGAPPAIDFSREMLVVATTGTSSSSAPVARFQGYRVRGDTLDVILLLTYPGGDCSASDDVARPIVIGRVPRWRKPVRFFDQVTFYCGGWYRDSSLHPFADTRSTAGASPPEPAVTDTAVSPP